MSTTQTAVQICVCCISSDCSKIQTAFGVSAHALFHLQVQISSVAPFALAFCHKLFQKKRLTVTPASVQVFGQRLSWEQGERGCVPVL